MASSVLLFAAAAGPAHGINLLIGFDSGPIITDGSLLDIDGVVNDQIIFAGNYGAAGYQVSGTLRQSPTWPVGQSLSGYVPPITGGLTLTNFVAEAVAGSFVGTPLTVRYQADYPGVFGPGTAVATLDAEVGNSLFSPVPPGIDTITFYQAGVFDNVSSVTILPSTGGGIPLGNPFHPGPGTTPYPVTGLGPVAVPAMTTPTILSSFQIVLGGPNNQFILPSSAEVGFTSQIVPEPGATALAALGMAGLAAAVARSRLRGGRPMSRILVCLGLLVWSAGAEAAPFAWTLNTNMTRFRVDVTTNNEVPLASNPFMSDSLASSASGTLYSADSTGMIWDVTGGFQVPVGPTGRTGIGDLVMGVNGLWGFSNASQELFFFDLGTSAVTSAQGITGLGGATITGVAYEGSSGDVYLSGNTGLSTDTLFRVPNAATAAATVGPMPNGDAFSYFSDIEFDTTGTLYAMSWYHRWFYTVSTANATTSLVSTGPHRDVTAMALTVPEPASVAVGILCSMLLVRRLTSRAATPGDRRRDPRSPA